VIQNTEMGDLTSPRDIVNVLILIGTFEDKSGAKLGKFEIGS
jgi:hypothetical protein